MSGGGMFMFGGAGEADPGSRNASESTETGASASRPGGPSPSVDQSAGALP
jgi:hypothetical protein